MTMEIISGNTTTYVPFLALDATDYVTPETGLTGITVQRCRNGGASWTAFTTPTIVEVGNGLYWLLMDEDTTIGSGFSTQAIALRFTHASMATVFGTVMLVRPPVTEGETLTVSSGELSGSIDANVTHVNDIEVGGSGTEVDPWGPA